MFKGSIEGTVAINIVVEQWQVHHSQSHSQTAAPEPGNETKEVHLPT